MGTSDSMNELLTVNGKVPVIDGKAITVPEGGGGGSAVVEELDVNSSGTYTPDPGVDGFNPVVVPAGTEGTPTATKGQVSNHSMPVTPKVTNSPGWIPGGVEKVGTPVTVTADELVSGKKTINQNGTGIDVTNEKEVDVAVPTGPAKSSSDLTVNDDTVTAPAGLYSSPASKSVAAGTEGTPVATKGQVSNNAITITPEVTNSKGFISGGKKTGTPVTVRADELISFSTIRTGPGAPSSSLGVDGDVYIILAS